MMRFRLLRAVCGIGLLVMLMVPVCVPAIHNILHAHEHHHCPATANDVHMHAHIYSCDLCDYLTTLAFFYESEHIRTEVASVDTRVPILHQERIQTTLAGTHPLRGPPESC